MLPLNYAVLLKVVVGWHNFWQIQTNLKYTFHWQDDGESFYSDQKKKTVQSMTPVIFTFEASPYPHKVKYTNKIGVILKET